MSDDDVRRARIDGRIVRTEPFRLFFPVGALLGALGVGHWLLYTLGLQRGYSGQAHAFVQVEAFLMAFACGFLLTMVPKRTGTAPAATWQIALLLACLLIVAVASLAESWVVAEPAYLVLLATLASFATSRLRGAPPSARPPDAFILVPIGLAQGAAGAVLVLVDVFMRAGWPTSVGRGLVQEGLWLCLVLGVGHLLFPAICGTSGAPSSGRHVVLLHALAGATIAVSFFVQAGVTASWGTQLATCCGEGLRGAVVLIDLAACVKAWRLPRTSGTHRKLAWLSIWLVPTGLLLAAAMPLHRVGLLHATFVGGFSLMTFAVATHVTAAHGGFDEILVGRPWSIRIFGGLVVFAMAVRITADYLDRGYWMHVGAAAGIWLIAVVTWMIALIPKTLAPRTLGDEARVVVQVDLPRSPDAPP